MNHLPTHKTVLSGVQPSNQLTLGNYLGALKSWVTLQAQNQCIFFAGNLHALTVRPDPEKLRDQTLGAFASYLAAGIDPKKSILFIQSDVPQHAELGWVISCFTYVGELNRMTQFKDKSAKQESRTISAGLFSYPTLMAADILLYRAHLVPVGEDQKQHLELTRDVATRINQIYGEDVFVIPEVFTPPSGARIMSLQNPAAKMSKSDADLNGTILLSDSNDQIVKKLKKAVTDSGSEISYSDDKPGIKNLLNIQAVLSDQKPEDLAELYRGKQYGHLKLDTADLIINTVEPIRNRMNELLSNPDYLISVVNEGAIRAQEKAQKTIDTLYERMGLKTRKTLLKAPIS